MLNRGKTHASLAAFEKAVKAKPNHWQARRGYAVALQRAERFPDALEQWRWLAKHAPGLQEAVDAVEFLETLLENEAQRATSKGEGEQTP